MQKTQRTNHAHKQTTTKRNINKQTGTLTTTQITKTKQQRTNT